MEALILLLMLEVKHFVLDSNMLQPTYVWDGKSTYGQWGGVQHAGVNALGTLFCFLLFTPVWIAIVAFVVDFGAHYHIDWLKGNFVRLTGATHSNMANILTYADQAVHQIVYIGLVVLLV